MRRLGPILPSALLLVFVASPVAAQINADNVRDEAKRTQPYKSPSMLSAQARFGALGEDWFFTAVIQLNYNQADWGVALQLPFRLRLKDRPPENDDVLRERDWDQATDYMKLLRYVYIGQADKQGPYFVQGGELVNLTIGHGTLMHRYTNNVDISRWHTGVNATSTLDGLSIEAMVGDVFAPYLMGTRIGVRPFELNRGFKLGWYDGFEVGMTLFADWVAPLALARDDMGAVLLDEDFQPTVSAKQPITTFGLDVGIPLPLGKAFTIMPYMDINKLSVVNNGWGFHLGTQLKLHIDRGLDHPFEAMFRAEFRRVSGDYLGQYFNTVYEIERLQTLSSRGATDTTKLEGLCNDVNCSGNAPPARSGVWLEASMGLRNAFYVGAEYVAYDGGRADGSLRLFLELAYFDRIQAKLFYYRTNTSGLSDSLGFDDRTAVLAEVRIPFLYVLSGNFRWVRLWDGIEPVDEWNVGLGVFVRL